MEVGYVMKPTALHDAANLKPSIHLLPEADKGPAGHWPFGEGAIKIGSCGPWVAVVFLFSF